MAMAANGMESIFEVMECSGIIWQQLWRLHSSLNLLKIIESPTLKGGFYGM